MKKIWVIFLVLATTQGRSQEKTISVEKSIFSVQTGFLGVWVNNESKLSSSIALRTEVGLDSGLFWKQNTKTGFLMVPSIGLEPRWYYNLDKRSSMGKKTNNNNGNFTAIAITYIPDWFVLSNYNDIDVVEQISIIPKWGMRRNIGKSNFNYELGAGLGYRAVFFDTKTVNEAALDLHMRIGYTF